MNFQVGQRVRSRVNAQGMTVGQELVVERVDRFVRLFVFTELVLRAADGSTVRVGNAHLVLEVVA